MKKLLTGILSAMLLLSLAAVPAGAVPVASGDAAKAYVSAAKKTQGLKTRLASSDTTFTMDFGSMAISAKMDMEMKIRQTAQKYEMAAASGTNVMGQALKVNYYYKDGYYYIDQNGQKLKTPMDLEAAVKVSEKLQAKNMPYGDMENLTMKKSGDKTTITYKIGKSKLNQYLGAAFEAMGQESLGITGDGNLRFTSMSGTATIDKDGYIVEDQVKIGFRVTVEKQEVKCTMAMDNRYQRPGADFQIEFPKDLDAYKLVSELP